MLAYVFATLLLAASSAVDPHVDATALAATLEPDDESVDRRLARQRAENAVLAVYGLPPVLIDPTRTRAADSLFPLLHRAAAGFGRAPAVLARTLTADAARLALVPAIAAEHFRAFALDPSQRDGTQAALCRQVDLYVGVHERIAAVRLLPRVRHGSETGADPVGPDDERDFLAIGADGGEVLAAFAGDPSPLAEAFAPFAWKPAQRAAAAALALRSFGGPPPPGATGLAAELGAVVVPFLRRVESSGDLLTVLAAEAQRPQRAQVDLHARVEDPEQAAALLAYILKRIVLDPALAGAQSMDNQGMQR